MWGLSLDPSNSDFVTLTHRATLPRISMSQSPLHEIRFLVGPNMYSIPANSFQI